MRKLIVCNLISIDGFVAGTGGDLSVMPFANGFSEYNIKRLEAADTMLLGRKTFEMFRGYWPNVLKDDKQPPTEREVARLNNPMPKLVISDSLKAEEATGWGPTTVARRSEAVVKVTELKKQTGRDILMFGSHLVWNELLKQGLVDELHFMIGAGAVVDGVKAFEVKPPKPLRLIETRPLENSPLVLVRYAAT